MKDEAPTAMQAIRNMFILRKHKIMLSLYERQQEDSCKNLLAQIYFTVISSAWEKWRLIKAFFHGRLLML